MGNTLIPNLPVYKGLLAAIDSSISPIPDKFEQFLVCNKRIAGGNQINLL
jgi:hypothetical protein